MTTTSLRSPAFPGRFEAAGPLCVAGQNCTGVARADRAAFLVDGDAYFEALTHAIANAKRSIFIAGWDVDSRVHLNRGYRKDLPASLGELLNAVVSKEGGPTCYVLAWDFAVIYAFEREALTSVKLGWSTHPRLRFQLDDIHPVAASHHQKFAVIDDRLAFVGGMDLCGHRWDTTEHKSGDERRKDPWKPAYGPFHDAQAAVSGDAARIVAAYARERWHRATGETLPAVVVGDDPWPKHLVPDVVEADVAVVRTDPAYDDRPDVRECERLFVDSIRAAKRHLYIENQYLTSHVIEDALAERLLDEDCPEIVILQPNECCGWLEQSTMGILRARLIGRLRKLDVRGRMKIYAPMVPDEAKGTIPVNLHTKIMIVDDRLARVGSANLSNRSLGFDTELDVAVEARGEPHVARGIAGFRARLLAEHLGCTEAEVHAAMDQGSLIAAVEQLRGGDRTLIELDSGPPEWLAALVPENLGVDPEAPSPADQFVTRVLPLAETRSRRRPLLAAASVLLILCALAAAWKFTALREYADPAHLRSMLAPFVGSPIAPFVSVGAFVLGSLLMLPVTLLVFQAGVLFGPLLGFPIALAGALISSAVSYWIGRALGKDVALRAAGRMRHRLNHLLVKRGILSVAVLRLLPVAPFTIVNLAAGASRVRFADFMLGSLIGMSPGIFALTVFSNSLVDALADPSPRKFLGVAAALVAVVAVGIIARRVILKRKRAAEPEAGAPDAALPDAA